MLERLAPGGKPQHERRARGGGSSRRSVSSGFSVASAEGGQGGDPGALSPVAPKVLEVVTGPKANEKGAAWTTEYARGNEGSSEDFHQSLYGGT